MTTSHCEAGTEKVSTENSTVDVNHNNVAPVRGGNSCDLKYSQVLRLHLVMDGRLSISGNARQPQFPCISVQMKELVGAVRNNLDEMGVLVKDVRLNGGAASYVLASEDEQSYNDFDLIFRVDLGNGDEGTERVKRAVLMALQGFIPTNDGNEEDKPSLGVIEDVYVHKMVKVANEHDRWSLISLANSEGCDVELKFVDKMRRQFEFSVDSFQILLDNLLSFYSDVYQINSKFYPHVLAESVYGSFEQALEHLNKKQIATDAPEQIRGGGLLKYCQLVARGYTPVNKDFRSMTEKYMCSRFFIDFPSIDHQRAKLESHLLNHFSSRRNDDGRRRCTGVNSVGVQRSEDVKFEFLTTLYAVVEESSVCLMGQERAQTLNLIQSLAQRTLSERHIPSQYHMFQHVPARYSQQQPLWRWSSGAPGRVGFSRSYCGRGDRHREPTAYYHYLGPQYYSDATQRSHMVTHTMWPYIGHMPPQYYVTS